MTPEILPRGAFYEAIPSLCLCGTGTVSFFERTSGPSARRCEPEDGDIPQKTLEVKQECLTQKS